jgi:hypothetical protein
MRVRPLAPTSQEELRAMHMERCLNSNTMAFARRRQRGLASGLSRGLLSARA